LSTEVLYYTADTYFSPWPEGKIESIVDKLVSIGLMYWDNELVLAGEQFEGDELLRPSENYVGNRQENTGPCQRNQDLQDIAIGEGFLRGS
jgi:hypothetical protein